MKHQTKLDFKEYFFKYLFFSRTCLMLHRIGDSNEDIVQFSIYCESSQSLKFAYGGKKAKDRQMTQRYPY